MELTLIPNKGLTQKTKPLKAADVKAGVYAELIAEMKKDMVTHNGIGLAANQIGTDLSLFVIDEKLAAEYGVPAAYANPEITEYGKESDDVEEGCLSVPGLWTNVKRAKKIMFKALNADTGERVKFRARGMLARVLQHETDHLNGTTIKDRTHGK
jgi:peptide deformylase